jgi:hypothetical protein
MLQAYRLSPGPTNPGAPDLLIHFGIGPPELFMRAQVNGINDAPRSNAVEHAVEDQRRCLLMCFRIPRRQRNFRGPRHSEPADIGGIDLLERTEALLGPIHAMSDPFLAGRASGLEQRVIHLPRLLGESDPCTRRENGNLQKTG